MGVGNGFDPAYPIPVKLVIGKNLTNHFIESSGFDLTYTGSGAGTATGVHADTRTSVYDPRTVAIQGTFRF